MVSCLSTLGIFPLPRCAPLAGRYTIWFEKKIECLFMICVIVFSNSTLQNIFLLSLVGENRFLAQRVPCRFFFDTATSRNLTEFMYVLTFVFLKNLLQSQPFFSYQECTRKTVGHFSSNIFKRIFQNKGGGGTERTHLEYVFSRRFS